MSGRPIGEGTEGAVAIVLAADSLNSTPAVAQTYCHTQPGGQAMPAKVLATRIELFRALCEDIKNNAGRGSLTSAEIQALRDDLLAAGNECELDALRKGDDESSLRLHLTGRLSPQLDAAVRSVPAAQRHP